MTARRPSVIYDSSIYISAERGTHREILADRTVHVFLSPVVVAEVLGGLKDRRLLQAFRGLVVSAETTGRLIDLPRAQYSQSGEVLRKLRQSGRDPKTILCDVLIAVSARSLGATVVTSDRADFERIQSVFPFSLRAVAAHPKTALKT